MAVLYTENDAIGLYDFWTQAGVGTKWDSVNLPVNDATYVFQAALDKTQSFTHANTIVALGGLLYVRGYMRVRYDVASGEVQLLTRETGVGNSAVTAGYTLAAGWEETEWPTASDIPKNGGGAWSWADFTTPAHEIIVYTSANPVNNAFCSVLCFALGYDAGGAFSHHLLQWLPPILAVASHALMKSEIVKILKNINPRPSNDEDFARIVEAFRVRPKFSGLLAPCRVSRGGQLALPGAP